MKYESVVPENFDMNAFNEIGKRWMLIGAYDKDKDAPRRYNAMTASWGSIGVMWGKPVFWCFVRPQRYTLEFLDAADTATLSFFPDDMHSALSYCGKASGRDEDKLAKCGLTPVVTEDGELMFEQAETTIVGKKIYRSAIVPEGFAAVGTGDIDSANYPKRDYHIVFCYEITDIRVKRD